MAARNGMTELIQRLRAMTNTGTADYTVSATSYWTDDQLQTELDRNRIDHYRELMTPQQEYLTGTAVYQSYYFGVENIEGSASGTVAWKVEDSAGSLIATSGYTLFPDSGYIRFTANQTGGSAYYASFREYDLDRAAASVWEMKAAHVADRFDIKTDNHQLSRSQLMRSYRDMAKQYRGSAKPRNVRLTREDAY